MRMFKIVSSLLLVLTISYSIEAQTKPRRVKSKSIPVSVVRSVEAEVVSRNDDENVNSSPKPTPTPTPDEEFSDDPQERLIQKIDKMSDRLKGLTTRVGTLETQPKADIDAQQKKILLRLDILSRAEQRAESLRKQLFELIEKENDSKTKLDDAEYQSRTEVIERSGIANGSLRPEEIREQRKKSLETQKLNYKALLLQIQSSRANLEDSVLKADSLVIKLREKLEAEIDLALDSEK
jgi:hypothetical protein